MGNDADEKVLALPREYLFGLRDEFLFNGFIGHDTSTQGSASAQRMDDFYKRAFQLVYEQQQTQPHSDYLFHPKKELDDKEKRDPRPDLIQIITYSIFYVKNTADVSFFVADIATTSSLKGQTLSGLLSVGWGGHITPHFCDYLKNEGHKPNPYNVLHDGHSREIGEEVRMEDMYSSIKTLGWLYLPNEEDGISPRHLAHVAVIRMPSRSSLTVQPGELEKSINPRWLTQDTLAESSTVAPWTRAMLAPLRNFFTKP